MLVTSASESLGGRVTGELQVRDGQPWNGALSGVAEVSGSPETQLHVAVSFVDPATSAGWTVRSAELRFFALENAADGPSLHVTGPQGEAPLPWPVNPTPVADVGPVSADQWMTYDVTALVKSGPELQRLALLPAPSAGTLRIASSQNEEMSLRPRLRVVLERTVCTYRGNGGGKPTATHRIEDVDNLVRTASASDGAGGFVTAGHLLASGSQHRGLVITHFGPDGAQVSTRTYAAESDVTARAIAVSPDGSLVIAGNYDGSTDLGSGSLPLGPPEASRPPMFLARFTSTGGLVWAKGFLPGGDEVTPRALATDAAGNVVVSGSFAVSVNLGGADVLASEGGSPEDSGTFLMKADAQGVHLWSKTLFTAHSWEPSRHGVKAVATDATGAILVSGETTEKDPEAGTMGGVMGPFVARYSAAGTLLWKRVFEGAREPVVAVAALADGRVAWAGGLVGTFDSAGRAYRTHGFVEHGSADGNASDVFVGVMSQAGVDAWTLQLGEPGEDEVLRTDVVTSLVADAGGSLTLSGVLEGTVDLGSGTLGDGRRLPFVARFDAEGATLWSRTYPFNDRATGLQLFPSLDGGVLAQSQTVSAVTSPAGNVLGTRLETFVERLAP